MNATSPAKVARVKASHPVTYQHGDESDNRSAKGHVPMLLAAVCAVMAPFVAIGIGYGIAAAVGYARSAA